jgi:hypothetical protein
VRKVRCSIWQIEIIALSIWGPPMGHIEGGDRDQVTLFPEALETTSARGTRSASLVRSCNASTWRGWASPITSRASWDALPTTPPTCCASTPMASSRIRSSRQLEREANRNAELIWLLRRLTPDFKTIADFREDNAQPAGSASARARVKSQESRIALPPTSLPARPEDK